MTGAIAYTASGIARADSLPVEGRAGILGHQIIGRGSEMVIVLHEWLGDHVNWQPTWPYLDAERFSFVFGDLRGYGWSKTMPGTFTLNEAVDDTLRLADELGARRFHLVGHSMSGMIAQRVAQKAAGRIKSATLICPVSPSGFKADEAALRGLNAVIEDDAAATKAFIARGGARYGETWLRCKLKIARNASTKEAMRGYLRMFTQNDFAAEIKGLETPILVLAGRHDIPVYQETSQRAALGPLYPRLEITISEEAGHYPMLETPILVASQIERHIKKFAG
jgi:3-oxoadipate enol-lactonase